MPTATLLLFGPYVLDTAARRLTREGDEVPLSAKHFDLLCVLTARPGVVHTKDALIEAVWRDVAVTPNSLDQAIATLRRALPMPSGEACIQTRVRRGVVFTTKIEPAVRRESDRSLEAVLDTQRAWIEGRAALETLDIHSITRARIVFDAVVKRLPEMATAHVGLANACALQFETTRTDTEPDFAALRLACEHAREACRLDPKYGEAWATLGFVLERLSWGPSAEAQSAKAEAGPVGREDALAAHRESIRLEPDNWRHHVRLAAASWGEERLREARRTLVLLPGLAMAHWLAATVLVARQRLDDAQCELELGLASHALPNRFSAIGLHWLLGLILMAKRDDTGARDAFERELQLEDGGHLYAREVAANSWYAIGGLRWRQGDREGARDAFREAVRRVPAHPLAWGALGIAPDARLSGVDKAIAEAVLALCTDGGSSYSYEHAAAALESALADAPPGNAGWLLPVEPIAGASHSKLPCNVLALLCHRAS